MIATNLIEYSDGTYSATKIEHNRIEGDTCKKYLEDVANEKVQFIGELHCFDKNGNYQILRNLQSGKFRSNP